MRPWLTLSASVPGQLGSPVHFSMVVGGKINYKHGNLLTDKQADFTEVGRLWAVPGFDDGQHFQVVAERSIQLPVNSSQTLESVVGAGDEMLTGRKE